MERAKVLVLVDLLRESLEHELQYREDDRGHKIRDSQTIRDTDLHFALTMWCRKEIK